MELVKKSGQMDLSTQVSMSTLRRKVKENMCGLMVTSTSAVGELMLSMGKESTSGLTEENTVVSGKTT